MIKAANSLIRFLLELCALAALCWWGYQVGGFLLALVFPVAAAALWWLFVAPRATWFLPLPGRLLVEAVVFGGAAIGLFATGHPILGAVLAIVAVVNSALVHVWRQDEELRSASRARPPAS
jgi:hypothetical protein